MSVFKAISGNKNILTLKIESNIKNDNTIKKEILLSNNEYRFWFGELNYEDHIHLDYLSKPENKVLEELYMKFRFCKEIYISLLEPIDTDEYFYICFNGFNTKTNNEDYTLEVSYVFPKSLFKIEKENPYYELIKRDLNKTKKHLNYNNFNDSNTIEDDGLSPFIKFSKAYYNNINEKLITDESRHICHLEKAIGNDFVLMDLTSKLTQDEVINNLEIEYHPFYYILNYFKMMLERNKTVETVEVIKESTHKPWWKKLFPFL